MNSRILVAANSLDDAVECKNLLAELVDFVYVSSDPDSAETDFEDVRPAILILAFRNLAAADSYYLRLYCRSKIAQTHCHRTIILCAEDEEHVAAALCRKNYFNFCARYWSHPADSMHLAMAIDQAKMDIRDSSEVFNIRRKMESHIDHIIQLEREKFTGSGHADSAIGGRPKILIVDDDIFQYKIHQRVFDAENYELLFANSAVDALSVLRDHDPDLILMDYEMPALNGADIVRRLRLLQRFTRIPVIMLTGKSDQNVVKSCLASGANDYTLKPFKRDVLIAKATRFLNQRTAVS
jgi:CheY-like chemotaxis protein